MMKKNKIRRIIGQILLAFSVCFSIQILSSYLWGNDVNVPEELIDTAVFCVIYFAITFYLQRKQKAENADDNASKEK